MEGQRFDAIARALAGRRSRRGAVAGLVATIAAAVAGRGAVAQVEFCQEEGEGCTAFVTCCPGLECVTIPTNSNAGFCGGRLTEPPPPPPPPPPVSPPPPPPPPPPPTGESFTVELVCGGSPEQTIITNTGTAPITIATITSIDQPRPGEEPFAVSRTLAPGESVTFTTGPGATGPDALAGNTIYDNAIGTNEGARVTTENGTIREALCQDTGAASADPIGATTAAAEAEPPARKPTQRRRAAIRRRNRRRAHNRRLRALRLRRRERVAARREGG